MEVLQNGQQRLGDNHRGEEHDGDGPGERQQEVVDLACHDDEEGEEGHRDTQRGGEDGLQEVDGGIDAGLPARLALGHHLHIGVDNHDGVIDDHSKGYNQCRQRHRVQLDVEHIEQTERYKDGDGHCTCGY